MRGASRTTAVGVRRLADGPALEELFVLRDEELVHVHARMLQALITELTPRADLQPRHHRRDRRNLEDQTAEGEAGEGGSGRA